MPSYTYKCRECGVVADLTCSMKDYDNNKDKLECPKCGASMNRDYSKTNVGVEWKCDLPSMAAGIKGV